MSTLIGILNTVYSVLVPISPAPSVGDILLLETGDSVLLETGDSILLE